MISSPRRSPWPLFLLIFGVAMLFGCYTRHTWEDFWITFRTSRNFAEGHGLVYNVGDRLHTFTSPLGVLLPALAYAITGNSSDIAAVWIFRAMSASALAGAAVLLSQGARRSGYSTLVAGALVAWIAADAKTLDFTTNGMETAFLLLFVAWIFHTLLTRPLRSWLWLGLAAAGLMWTRPDSFIYLGAIGAGIFLFNDPARSGITRQQWLKTFLGAAVVTVVVYGPWLLVAKLYYGTPVPHTIIAKGLDVAPINAVRSLAFFKELPRRTWGGSNSFAAAFLPSYFDAGGWPVWSVKAAALLAILASGIWMLPRVRWEGRVASLAFLVGHIYLSLIAVFPFPWYLPTATLLGWIALAALAQTVRDAVSQIASAKLALLLWGALVLGASAIFMFSAKLAWGSARQLAAAQRIIEDGHRQQIGLYLREHAKKGDSVILEPLGYIGYFSQLKTYDYPGLSSREMVAARRKVGSNWAALINFLHPSWIVARDAELKSLVYSDAGITNYRYRVEKVFDVTAELAQLAIPGRNYLQMDQRFTLLHRVDPQRVETPIGPMWGTFPGSGPTVIDGVAMQVIHAPSEVAVPIPAGATEVTVQFGFPAAAYTLESEHTDGARFSLHWGNEDFDYQIWTQRLNPYSQPTDRGVHTITQKLPTEAGGTRLILRTVSEDNYTRDWTAWSAPVFK